MSWYGQSGRQIYYDEAGRGDAVLLLPGWAGSIIELGRLTQELSTGFRVVAADLPGSGRSEPQPRHYTASYYEDDAHMFLDLLDHLGIDAAHLVGFSDGGEDALLMATWAPDRVLSVVTWGAAGQVVASPEMLDALAHVVDDPTEELKPFAAYLVEAYGVDNGRIMAETEAMAMREIIASGGDISRSRAAQITSPALLITGTNDPFCPPELVHAMAEAIPDGRFLEALGAGHAVHLSHPDWLGGTVVDWLGGH